MTNKIKKLYELAGVKEVGKKHSCEISDFYNCSKRNCNVCDKARDKNYPPFTDTKQLELIKFLGKRKIIFAIFKNRLFWEFDCFNTVCSSDKDFSLALAGFVCALWSKLTKQQREQIKRILE